MQPPQADHTSPATGSMLPSLAAPAPMRAGTVATGVAYRAASSTTSINIWVLLRALRRRLVPAVLLGLFAAAVAAGLVWMLMPSAVFTATATLRVDSVPQQIIFKTTEPQIDFQTYLRTQALLIKSRKVLMLALSNPKVAPLEGVKKQADQVAWLEKSIQVDYSGEILRISMSGPEPQLLAAVVNGVYQAYLDEIVDREKKARRERYDRLKEIYRGFQARLQEKRTQLRGIADQIGSKDQGTVRYSHELALERRAMAERELMKIRFDLRSAQAEYRARQASVAASPGAGVSESQVEARLAQHPSMRQPTERLAQAQARYANLTRTVRNANDPSYLSALRELQESKASIESRRAALRPRVVEEIRSENTPQGDASLAGLEQQIRVFEELEQLTLADVEGISIESKALSRGSWNLEEVQSEIANIEAAAQRVGTEVESLTVELGADSRVRKFEEAEAPRRQSDKRLAMSTGAGGCALALVLLGFSLFEVLSRRVGSADQAMTELRLHLMGTLPAMPAIRGRRQPTAIEDPRWQHLLIESVDTMRSILLHIAATHSIRTIIVTSAVSGEGKTTLATHLATSLARSGRQTLLVDCDLRRPSVHRVFDIPAAPGLSEVLRGEARLEDVLQHVAGGLSILTAGLADPRSLQSLADFRTRETLAAWRDRFDFVLLDTPPVLPVADALAIGQHVDGAICSLMSGVSHVPKVRMAHERLAASGVRILGAVMVGEPWGGRQSGYGYSYEYGSVDGSGMTASEPSTAPDGRRR